MVGVRGEPTERVLFDDGSLDEEPREVVDVHHYVGCGEDCFVGDGFCLRGLEFSDLFAVDSFAPDGEGLTRVDGRDLGGAAEKGLAQRERGCVCEVEINVSRIPPGKESCKEWQPVIPTVS